MRRVAGLTRRVGGLAIAPILIDPPATGDAWLDRMWARASGVPETSLCCPNSPLGHGPARPSASSIAFKNLPHGNSVGGLLAPAKAWGAGGGEP
jgi:hypothetical protein